MGKSSSWNRPSWTVLSCPSTPATRVLQGKATVCTCNAIIPPPPCCRCSYSPISLLQLLLFIASFSIYGGVRPKPDYHSPGRGGRRSTAYTHSRSAKLGGWSCVHHSLPPLCDLVFLTFSFCRTFSVALKTAISGISRHSRIRQDSNSRFVQILEKSPRRAHTHISYYTSARDRAHTVLQGAVERSISR